MAGPLPTHEAVDPVRRSRICPMSRPQRILSVRHSCWIWLILLVAPCLGGEHLPMMLAGSYSRDMSPQDYWVSEKLDGVRGRWDGKRLWTRGGQPIRLPPWFVAGWPTQPMDGELWIERGRFEEVSALVRSSAPEPEAWRAVRFMVFDLPAHGGRFSERVAAMRELGAARHPHLQPVRQQRVETPAALDARLAAVVAAGGEGLMLHHADAYYRDGRSDALLKLKPFDDAEGTLVDYTRGRGKYRGQVGALVLRLDDGRLLRVGSGLSDADRAEPPPLGSRVTFRYSGLTSTGLPRFARFLRVRHE